jgi:predicted CoA-binding protein
MPSLRETAEGFLTQPRIAVAGVSRTRQDAANLIYRRLKAGGYQVFAVNPHAATVEGDACYPSVGAIPGGVRAVVIVTRPEQTEEIVRQCPQAGVTHVWMHRSLAHGHSVSPEALAFCEAHGIEVVAGGCPLMFGKTADLGHRCMRWLMRVSGRLAA